MKQKTNIEDKSQTKGGSISEPLLMKANNGKGNIIERDVWETPQWLFNKLWSQYNFTLDCCASKDNTKLDNYSTDFLNENHPFAFGWMNPPFSKAYEMFEQFFKIHKGVAIFRSDNQETKLWQEVIFPNATWIFKFKGRISYEGMEGKGSRFPSDLIGFNVEPPIGLDGTLLILNNKEDELDDCEDNHSMQ